jgi:hypothetical protein
MTWPDVSGWSVGRWAALDREWSPVDISDLEQLGKQSSAATRLEFARYFLAERSDAGE